MQKNLPFGRFFCVQRHKFYTLGRSRYTFCRPTTQKQSMKVYRDSLLKNGRILLEKWLLGEYIFVYTRNPNGVPCFDWKFGLLLEGWGFRKPPRRWKTKKTQQTYLEESFQDLQVVGGVNPSEKYARQNGFIIPNFRGENEQYLKPPPGQVVNNPYLQGQTGARYIFTHTTRHLHIHPTASSVIKAAARSLDASGSPRPLWCVGKNAGYPSYGTHGTHYIYHGPTKTSIFRGFWAINPYLGGFKLSFFPWVVGVQG